MTKLLYGYTKDTLSIRVALTGDLRAELFLLRSEVLEPKLFKIIGMARPAGNTRRSRGLWLGSQVTALRQIPPPAVAAQTISGTAATGDPLVGATVTVKDSNGKTAAGVTAADGTFSIAVTGMTPPFMLAAVPISGLNLYSDLPAMDMTTTNTQNVN